SFQRFQANLAPKQVGLEDLPVEMRRKYVSQHGKFLIQIHPAVNIWDREGAERFVGDLRSVEAAVTGTPVITYEAIRLMERASRQGTIYAIVLVVVVTALTLRRWRETLLALLPLVLGLVWTLGLMYFFDLKLTLGNIFGLPLLLGTAVEFGSNMVLRFMEGEAHGGPLIARSTVMAVLVNGLSTVVGFGSLMIAHHQGVFGLGPLLTPGMITSLLPASVRRRPRPPATGRAPRTSPRNCPRARRGCRGSRTSRSAHPSRTPRSRAPPAARPRSRESGGSDTPRGCREPRPRNGT